MAELGRQTGVWVSYAIKFLFHTVSIISAGSNLIGGATPVLLQFLAAKQQMPLS